MFSPANVNFISSTETSPPSQAASSDAEPGGSPSTKATSAPGHSAPSETLIFGSPGSACSTSNPITGTADTTVTVQEDELTLLLRTTKPPPVMCEDIWFDDGNIVLHVDKTIFRVHRSILAKHSSILRSMLSLPQPDNDQGKALPVIPLYDSAADAKELLMVLYNPFYFSNARHSFGFLSGISRLSTKYDIPSLRGEAINQLKCIFPTTFNAFEFMPSREAVESLAIRAVNLARETDCWEILPCAFYYCSRLPIPNIVRGTSGARLSRNDVDVCIIGRDLLLKKQRKVSHPFLYAPPPGLPKPSPNGRPGGCSAPATCVEGGNPGAVLKYLNGLDMLTPMALEIFTDWQKIGRCGACGDKQAAVHWIAVEKVWEELPQIFGLGTWESIEKRGD